MNRILVIEDDRDIAFLVTMHLRDHGATVDTCGNGEEGLKMASSGRFDLVILDLMLPGMDGLDVCRGIRSLATYTPILMLTAIHSSTPLEFEPDIDYLPVELFVDKPIEPEDLLGKVDWILSREKSRS